MPSLDKHIKMNIYLRIEIMNGVGGSIIEPAFEKEFMSSLIKETNGAIRPLFETYPHYNKSYPDNGWVFYYLDVNCDIDVNISQLLRDQAGCFSPIANLFHHSQDIANIIQSNIRESVSKKLNLKDIQVKLVGEKYYMNVKNKNK